MNCNVCNSALGDPIYTSPSDHVLTSLCELRPGSKRVWLCSDCGHLRGEALPDTEKYYATDYKILLDQEDEDQIYEVLGERIVYRTDHQVDTLLRKLRLPQGALMLDYGCAKASTFKRLVAHRNDLQVHLFDVSDMYMAHWDRFISPERWAVLTTPPSWQSRFDVVTSFFALEHIPAPQDTVKRIASFLKDDGVFYGVVPDTFGNIADFVVIDHVNHFTKPSLYTLLNAAGFSDISIDSEAHRGALVFVARMGGATSQRPGVTEVLAGAEGLAGYWTQLSDRIRSAERAYGDVPVAIYGSGFYGAYIASTLQLPNRLHNFLDRSPYQQGKVLFGKPIVAPEQLPADIRVLYVGLNPAIARATIAKMEWLIERDLHLVFLDESDR
jgi:SAM-dependent methyltransferase